MCRVLTVFGGLLLTLDYVRRSDGVISTLILLHQVIRLQFSFADHRGVETGEEYGTEGCF